MNFSFLHPLSPSNGLKLISFSAYRASDNAPEECRLNKEMLRAAVQSFETLSPELNFVTLITGTKVRQMFTIY